jgi:hypothetical protein
MPLYTPRVYDTMPGNLLTTGQATLHRDVASSSTLATGTGVLRLSYFTARKTETSTQCRVYSGGTAAAATPTLCRLALYTVAADAGITLVASTANDTTLFAGTSTSYTRSWSVAYALQEGSRYAFGVLVVTGAAAPTLVGQAPGASAEALLAPALSGQVTGQADLPASVASGSIVASGSRIYAAILP